MYRILRKIINNILYDVCQDCDFQLKVKKDDYTDGDPVVFYVSLKGDKSSLKGEGESLTADVVKELLKEAECIYKDKYEKMYGAKIVLNPWI